MKTFSKLLLFAIVTSFLFFACSKDEGEPEPQPIPKATLSTIDPNQGIKETEVTIMGTNFGTDKTKVKVLFNATEATIQSVTNTQIKTLAPTNGSTGPIKVSVGGTVVTGPIFTYLQPTLSGISPESAQQGTAISFVGSNFGTDATKIKVFFKDSSMNTPNESEAVIESVSNTEVVVIVPEQAQTGTVRMEVDGNALAGPEFILLELTITDYFPKSAQVGTEVTIIGNTFGTDLTKTQVFINDVEATIQSLTDTEIKILVPEGAITGILRIVTENDGKGFPFTVLPGITSISPESGIKEAAVTINGSAFGIDTSVVQVFFNGKEAEVLTVQNDKITTKVPNKAFTGMLTVIIDGTELEGPLFTYIVSEILVSDIAGSGFAGFTNGLGSAATFSSPQGIEVDGSGNIYVADAGNNSIRKISSDREVSTLAGNGSIGDVNGTGTIARFSGLSDLSFSSSDNLLVTDKNNFKIKRVTTGGVVTTYAGTGVNGSENGPVLEATFGQITGITVNSEGTIYVVENDRHRIRKITVSGEVSVFAGAGQAGTDDGNGTNARFNFPYGIAVDKEDNLYITDSSVGLLRKIAPNGDVTTLAGSTSGFADGQGTAAQFDFPTGIVVDKQGDIYVSDGSNNRIRKISPEGNVTTLAGDGTTTLFNQPRGITIDALGDLYIADRSNHRILKITQE
ncbi:IPT/TIG domain-containing protein [Maribacter sp. CXY002]|uniref:IPT/TIG domain-containing protein n=1 Tax=Maribacter luteocoastalis TaxID=3407671 RepID=UPI003B67CB93